jgi:hypothetical protein
MNIEQLKNKNLSEWIRDFGWQGGTIHQVKAEIERREKFCPVGNYGLWCARCGGVIHNGNEGVN